MIKLSRRQLAQAFIKLTARSHSQAVKVLAAYLVQTNRVRELDLVLNDIAQEVYEQSGRVYAKVTSARVVDESLRAKLISIIKQLSNATTVEIRPKIDESLIGGLIIETPELELDLSVRGKLNQLRTL